MNYQKIANSDQTLLITGNTGTGKTHLAKQIHELGKRKQNKFISVNLATLSENLIESELFGHEKGSFSGADMKRIGKLEIANGGTVFLDEIGELSPRLQTKLLDALNSKTISPVGSNRDIHLDIRFITATNRNLELLVEEGHFREDLYYRINTFHLHLPNLTEQKSKIPELATAFIQEACQKQNRDLTITQEFLHSLTLLPWPGNVRQLKNSLEYAVAICAELELKAEDLPPLARSVNRRPLSSQLAEYPLSYTQAKTEFEKKYFEFVLRKNAGKINHTARVAGVSKVTLIEKVKRYNIDIPQIKYQNHINKGILA